MNRSQFIWKSLQESFDADLLIVRRSDDTDDDIKAHAGEYELTVLQSEKEGGLLPSSIDRFPAAALREFRDQTLPLEHS